MNIKVAAFTVSEKSINTIFASTRENLSSVFANNKGADQTVHPRSLISAYVIRLLKSTIAKLAANELSIFQLVSVAEQTGLSLVLSETPKTGFVVIRPISYSDSENSIGCCQELQLLFVVLMYVSRFKSHESVLS